MINITQLNQAINTTHPFVRIIYFPSYKILGYTLAFGIKYQSYKNRNWIIWYYIPNQNLSLEVNNIVACCVSKFTCFIKEFQGKIQQRIVKKLYFLEKQVWENTNGMYLGKSDPSSY